MSNFVKLFNAALDDAPDSPTQIVLRGALDISTLKFLRQDIYQRDPQAYASQYNILEALETNQPLPDIELGMRGHEWFSREGDFTLKDPTYIIDGLQRVSTIIEWVERNPDRIPKLGALVHFNTTRAWERERFHALNNYRRRLSPNVLLRNMRETNTAIATLYGLCFNDTKFALFERVSWEQNMRRQEIIPALLLTKIANRLHSHVNTAAPRGTNGPGRGSANIENVASALKNRADLVKLGVLRQNVVEPGSGDKSRTKSPEPTPARPTPLPPPKSANANATKPRPTSAITPPPQLQTNRVRSHGRSTKTVRSIPGTKTQQSKPVGQKDP